MAHASTSMTRIGIVLLVVCVLAVPLVISPTIAGDSPAIYSLEFVDEPDVDPGETITAEVHFSSGGGHGDRGIVALETSLSYDTDVLSIEAVDRGEYFESDGADTTITIDNDTDEGLLTVEQQRDPPEDGSIGSGVILTITFVVAADAEPTNANVEIVGFSSILSGDVPQPTFDHTMERTVLVAGGVDEPEDDVNESSDDPAGITLAEDQDPDLDEPSAADSDAHASSLDNSPDGEESAEEKGDNSVTHAVPGFALVGAIVALLVASTLANRLA